MNWFETLKAADFGFYSDYDQAGTYLQSPFQQRQTPIMSRQETDKILADEPDWNPSEAEKSQFYAQNRQMQMQGLRSLQEGPSRQDLRQRKETFHDKFVPDIFNTGAKGKYGISQQYLGGADDRYEDAAVTNLSAYGQEYEEPRNPYSQQFHDEFQRRKARQGEIISEMERLIAEGKTDTPEYRQLDEEVDAIDPYGDISDWREQLGEKEHNWELSVARQQAIGEADKKIIPSLVNTNVHEVGHNATMREIHAAIDAEEGLTPEQKQAKKKYADEYAAFTIGDFSDPRLAYDEDGNPLDEEERWQNVIQSRQDKMKTHPATWEWAEQLKRRGGQQ